MPINAKNVTPGQAAMQILVNFLGNLRLRKEDPRTNLLSYYLQGEPGVGKSSVAEIIARTLNYYLYDIRANQMSPDDAGGIRMPNVETKTTDWYPPEWLPNPDGTVVVDGVTYAGTVLLFDELASADDRVRKPLFGVFLDRRLNGRRLPDNCLVIAAGNESETGTMVFELDNATRTRFITLRIQADFTSWVTDFAPVAKITPTVVAFLKNNEGRFCMTEEALEKGLDLYGNPRSWEHVSICERSMMESDEERDDEQVRDALETMIAGKVGEGLASEFMALFDIVTKMTTLRDLLDVKKKNPAKLAQLWPKDLSQLHALSYSMMAYPKDVKTALEIFELSDHFPDNSHVPFKESFPAILEVVLKRLRESGVPQSEFKKFAKWTSNTFDEVVTGPLIRIKL